VQVTKIDLPSFLHVLRPDGVLLMLQVTAQTDGGSKPAAEGIISTLTLGGFVKPLATKVCHLSPKLDADGSFFSKNYEDHFASIVHVNRYCWMWMFSVNEIQATKLSSLTLVCKCNCDKRGILVYILFFLLLFTL